MPAIDPHLELRAVSKRYGPTVALDDITVTFGRGRVHALVGENGAGKSTLGKIVAGVVSPDAGTMRLGGERVSYRSPRGALAHGVSMVAQELCLVPAMSVLDNVFLGQEPRRAHTVVDRRALRRAYRDLTERSGFAPPMDAPVGSLRLADQQKVEIMRALAGKAQLIVLDEPTAALTAAESAALLRWMRALRESGVTLVFVSHFLDEVLEVADDVTVLKDGRVVDSTAADGLTKTALVRMMLGRSLELTFPPKQPPAATAPVVLQARHLRAGEMVRDVSLEVRAGEILGIAGLVGSGRTEVARVLFGADRLDSGSISCAGRSVRLRRPADAIRAGIAMLPKDRKQEGLIVAHRVHENVTLPRLDGVTRHGVLRASRERAVSLKTLRRVGVEADPRMPVGALSGGNQQRVMLGKWLARTPHVLVANQPTRGIDISARLSIYELLTGLAAGGMGIVVISDEVEEILGLSHRVLVMRRGAVVAELSGDEATEDTVMGAALGVTGSDLVAAGGNGRAFRRAGRARRTR